MKIKTILFSAAGILVLAAVAVVGSGYLRSFGIAGEVEVPTLATLVPDRPDLGQTVRAELEFELPLCRSIEHVVFEPGDGAVAVGEPRIRRGAWKWSRQEWKISGDFRCFRPGTVQPGVLTVEISPAESGTQPELFTAAIPDFEVTPGEAGSGNELMLAGAVDAARNHVGYGWFWLLLLLPAILIWWIIRRRNSRLAVELPPWERALQALGTLREELANHRIPLETGFARLTDLVRNYLEKRFEIPASTRTTSEFLSDLDRKSSPLPPAQRPFLRDFLLAADQVKFAKAPPDTTLLNDALSRAEELIESTRITPEGEEGGEQ